jgi:hypothetical protein
VVTVRGSVLVTEEFYRMGRPLRVLTWDTQESRNKKTQAAGPGLGHLIQNAIQKLTARWAVQINRIRNA